MVLKGLSVSSTFNYYVIDNYDKTVKFYVFDSDCNRNKSYNSGIITFTFYMDILVSMQKLMGPGG